MTASLNPYLSHFGEEFDAEKSSFYRLTIQFSLGGFSFALLDTQSHTLLALECYQSDLLTDSDDIFHALECSLESKGLNNKVFQSVICLIDDRTNTLIPSALFDETEKEKYLDFVFHTNKSQIILYEQVKHTDCVNIFAWSKNLYNKITSKWKNISIVHTSSLFIDYVMMSSVKEPAVFVNVRNRNFDMVIKKNGRLGFFNNFKFNTKDDFAYFLVFAMEQNNLSGEDTTVSFSGLIQPASEIVDLCGRYIKDIRFAENPNELHVSKALGEIPFQYYFIHYQSFR